MIFLLVGRERDGIQLPIIIAFPANSVHGVILRISIGKNMILRQNDRQLIFFAFYGTGRRY